MNKKNTEKLFKEFPKLYEGHKHPPRESLMSFGFACNDGWFDIIYKLSKDITALDPKARAEQVKEKFGGLRFYAVVQKREVFDLINKASEESHKTCEICGKKGTTRYDLEWYLTLCQEHYEKRKEDIKQK